MRAFGVHCGRQKNEGALYNLRVVCVCHWVSALSVPAGVPAVGDAGLVGIVRCCRLP
jgi:hypothetical protein